MAAPKWVPCTTYMVVYDNENFVYGVTNTFGAYFRGGTLDTCARRGQLEVVVNETGTGQEYFVYAKEFRRLKNGNKPCLPGGRLEESEKLEGQDAIEGAKKGAMREWEEEMGIEVPKPTGLTTVEFKYQYPEQNKFQLYYGTYCKVDDAKQVAENSDSTLNHDTRASQYDALLKSAKEQATKTTNNLLITKKDWAIEPSPQSDEMATTDVYAIADADKLFGKDSWYTNVIRNIPEDKSAQADKMLDAS